MCLDVSQMKNIVEVNVEDFDCTIESGVTREGLNSYIRDTGLQFPVGQCVLCVYALCTVFVMCAVYICVE